MISVLGESLFGSFCDNITSYYLIRLYQMIEICENACLYVLVPC